ncbi:MAG TPA: MarR family transcriptional regulator [Steroidobacteraceae bacterium]|jgi:DNA-binding MarR family transcriptional regulator|nr:MarR family transcriptional regulator [Steroidobacteraceae bacterium]
MTATARKTRDLTAPVPPPEDDVHRMICRQLKHVVNSLWRRVDLHMQPLDLTGMQWEPVLMLWLKRADTVAGLARVSQMGVASMTRMLDRLEEKDLLRRERSELDRRVVNLHLTPKGRKAASKIWPIVVEGMHVHLNGFKKEELVQLDNLLGRMLANGARDVEKN